MNWDQIEGKWERFTGSARDRWGKLTDDDWPPNRRQKGSVGRMNPGAVWGGQSGRQKASGGMVARVEGIRARKPRCRPPSETAPWQGVPR